MLGGGGGECVCKLSKCWSFSLFFVVVVVVVTQKKKKKVWSTATVRFKMAWPGGGVECGWGWRTEVSTIPSEVSNERDGSVEGSFNDCQHPLDALRF